MSSNDDPYMAALKVQPVHKTRARDGEAEPGWFGWLCSPRHVHFYRKMLRRLMLLGGIVFFVTGILLTVLAYSPSYSYKRHKATGPALVVIGGFLILLSALWMIYKKEIKPAAMEKNTPTGAEMSQLKSVLGNPVHNNRLLHSAQSRKAGVYSVDETLTGHRRHRRKTPAPAGPETSGSNHKKVSQHSGVPVVMIEEVEIEEYPVTSSTGYNKKTSSDQMFHHLQDTDNEDDLELHHKESTKDQVQTLAVPGVKPPKKGGGPIKNKKFSGIFQDVTVEHHNIDKRDTTAQLSEGNSKHEGKPSPLKKDTLSNEQIKSELCTASDKSSICDTHVNTHISNTAMDINQCGESVKSSVESNGNVVAMFSDSVGTDKSDTLQIGKKTRRVPSLSPRINRKNKIHIDKNCDRRENGHIGTIDKLSSETQDSSPFVVTTDIKPTNGHVTDMSEVL